MKRRSFLKSTLLAIAATASGLRVAEAGIVLVEPEIKDSALFLNMTPYGFKEGDIWATSMDDSIHVMTSGEWVKIETSYAEYLGLPV